MILRLSRVSFCTIKAKSWSFKLSQPSLKNHDSLKISSEVSGLGAPGYQYSALTFVARMHWWRFCNIYVLSFKFCSSGCSCRQPELQINRHFHVPKSTLDEITWDNRKLFYISHQQVFQRLSLSHCFYLREWDIQAKRPYSSKVSYDITS